MVLCIIQARMGSSRLPGKVLRKVVGVPLLRFTLDRLKRSKEINKLVVATGEGAANDPIEALARDAEVECFRGSEDDVLSRFARASDAYPDHETIVRVTGDCPLIDPEVVDRVITFYHENGFEYASNVSPPTFPDGLDVEVFSRKALARADQEAKRPSEREHVTIYLRGSGKFRTGNLTHSADLSAVRLTVDREEDLEVVSFLLNEVGSDAPFIEYVETLQAHPEVARKNKSIERNEKLEKTLREEKPHHAKNIRQK